MIAEAQTVSVVEAARRLGIGRSLAYEAAQSGELPAIRIGRRLVVPLAALEAMLRPDFTRKAGGEPDGGQAATV